MQNSTLPSNEMPESKLHWNISSAYPTCLICPIIFKTANTTQKKGVCPMAGQPPKTVFLADKY